MRGWCLGSSKAGRRLSGFSCRLSVGTMGAIEELGTALAWGGEKNFTAEAQRTQRELERFPFGCLALKQEGLWELAFTADFEGAEILVPQAVRRFWLGFAPEL